jgi:ABC-type lipoprotein export system ATPase subunit
MAFVELLSGEAKRAGSTIIFVSHDRRLAGRFDQSLELVP